MSRPCSVHSVHLYTLYTLYTCGEMSECDDTPSQLWGCHSFSQTTHVIPRSAITSVTHQRGCPSVLAKAQERSSLQLSISNIVSIDNEACNFQFTRLKIKCYVGGWNCYDLIDQINPSSRYKKIHAGLSCDILCCMHIFVQYKRQV